VTSSPSRPRSDAVAPLDRPDPVAAVLQAHRDGAPLVLGTSGSTGRSRGVRRTTASWFDSFPVVAELTGLGRGARVWVPGPLAGTMNLFAAVLARWAGATLVDRLPDATHAHLTPTVLRRLGPEDLAGRHVTVAGDRLDQASYDVAVAAGARVAHYYGAAELSFVGWGAHEDDLAVFPGVEVSVRDGVLWARSPYLAEVPTVEGFATVGDRGELDGTRLRVHGRGDAAVLTGGATVLVEDVETALRPVAGGEVVVLGVPHADLGQVVGAVLTDAADLSACRAVPLPPSHRPRLWYAVPSLPRTAAGKVDRAALGALVREGALTRVVP
jgi:long-chain acyl-CoA synthetase